MVECRSPYRVAPERGLNQRVLLSDWWHLTKPKMLVRFQLSLQTYNGGLTLIGKGVVLKTTSRRVTVPYRFESDTLLVSDYCKNMDS